MVPPELKFVHNHNYFYITASKAMHLCQVQEDIRYSFWVFRLYLDNLKARSLSVLDLVQHYDRGPSASRGGSHKNHKLVKPSLILTIIFCAFLDVPCILYLQLSALYSASPPCHLDLLYPQNSV